MIVQKGLVRILIVDDDEDDFFFTSDYIKHIAGGNFKIDWCPKYKDALQHMIARNYDLYFVDYLLGAKSGVDLLKEALANNCEEPIILLTGKGNYEVDIEAMQLGAVDYLIKTDLSTEKIERSIRYALERSATLKALKANERKYRSIFERSKDLVFIADAELNFIDVNEVVTPLLGYAKDEALQLNIYDLVEQDGSRQFLKQAIEEQKEVNDWEVMLTTKSGEKKWCILTAAYEDNVNSQSYVQGIIHDISNLKRAEKATLQAEKLAAAGRLVRTLAHEVRNPLNNITLSIEQLQQDIKDENGLMFMDIIHRNSRRISDLISELLSTSRPTEIVMQEYVLQEVIDDVVEVAIDRLTLKRIKLQISYPDEPQYVMADKEKLRIAILNIVINAIEAMEEQTGNLSISLHHLLRHVVLNISDNGCGIPEENISRLFEPYFTQKRNGMGLGLASTLNILQAHNANIEVSSVVNGGTTFTITFPLVKNDED